MLVRNDHFLWQRAWWSIDIGEAILLHNPWTFVRGNSWKQTNHKENRGRNRYYYLSRYLRIDFLFFFFFFFVSYTQIRSKECTTWWFIAWSNSSLIDRILQCGNSMFRAACTVDRVAIEDESAGGVSNASIRSNWRFTIDQGLPF